MTIGLVVKNEEDYIKKCLESILALDYPAQKVEILVADGRSSDKTIPILKQFEDRADLRILDNEKEIISAGRNLIVRKSGNGLIAFTDGDCEVRPDWLSRLVQDMEARPDIACAGGPNAEFKDDPPLARLFAEVQGTFLGSGGSAQSYEIDSAREVASIPNCNALYRREWLQKAGLYDERFNVGEDADLNFRIRREGGRFLYDPKALVRHHRRTSWRAFARNNYRYGLAMAKLFKKYRRIVRWYAPLPSLAMAVYAGLIAASFFSTAVLAALLLVSAACLLILAALGLALSIRKRNPFALLAPLAYGAQITAYGLGFIEGMLKKHEFHGPSQ